MWCTNNAQYLLFNYFNKNKLNFDVQKLTNKLMGITEDLIITIINNYNNGFIFLSLHGHIRSTLSPKKIIKWWVK